VAFFLDPNPTVTSLMLTSEHGSLAVLGGLRHPELLPETLKLICDGTHITPVHLAPSPHEGDAYNSFVCSTLTPGDDVVDALRR
jgi:hypothetical protein